MFLVNFLSRSDTDKFAPMFEIIYSLEIVFIVLTYIAASLVIFAAYKASKIHRIVGLRITFPILLYCLYAPSRLAVMHHQYYGPSYYVETFPLILGSMMKEIFLGYMTSLVAIISLDRWIATNAWAWYERDSASTLYFFVLQETIIFSISISIAYLVVFEYMTSMDSTYCFGVLIAIGCTSFALVFRHNRIVMQELKRGAEINKYSVSRTYQIEENISVLKSASKIARPIIAVCLPPFIFFPVFVLIPRNIGFDGLRFFSVSMYELWISIASFVIIVCVPFYFPRLKLALKRKGIVPVTAPTEIEQNPKERADTYFTLLSNDLMRPGASN